MCAYVFKHKRYIYIIYPLGKTATAAVKHSDIDPSRKSTRKPATMVGHDGGGAVYRRYSVTQVYYC